MFFIISWKETGDLPLILYIYDVSTKKGSDNVIAFINIYMYFLRRVPEFLWS